MRILQEPSTGAPVDDRDPALQLLARARFRVSVAELDQLPPPDGLEVAFAGRSNAGKSSAINALARQKNLAFASKTPGRTRLINFFDLDEQRHLVDLPGYGYAAAPARVRKSWQLVVGDYLAHRSNLVGLVLLMDIRHPLTPLDRQLLAWFAPRGLPVHVLLTKTDKLTRPAAQKTLATVGATLEKWLPGTTVQLFSILAKTGIVTAARTVAGWLQPAADAAGCHK